MARKSIITGSQLLLSCGLGEDGQLLLPSLRLSKNRVLADLPVEFAKPPLISGQAQVVLAADWGERRLLTATDL